jgi:hypothetical protein
MSDRNTATMQDVSIAASCEDGIYYTMIHGKDKGKEIDQSAALKSYINFANQRMPAGIRLALDTV